MNVPDNPPGKRAASESTSEWERFRSQMPVAEKWAYFDHAAVAPLPKPTAKAVAEWAESASQEGDVEWPQWQTRYEQTRRTAASMVNATPEEIAFIPSTTAGISYVAEGMPWQVGDNVVTLENEFPSNLYPWMNLASRGVETRRVPVAADGQPDLQRLADACDDRTRIVSVSWIGYASGWRIDVDAVAELAHQAGALFFLDAIQGVGVFPLDVQKTQVDFFAADGHKWMLGPEGAGLFYCRSEHLERLRPIMIGWNSVVNRYAFDTVDLSFRKEAARYEGGSPNTIGIHALGASLDLLVEQGGGPSQSAVGDRILEVTNYARQRLADANATILSQGGGEHHSGILVFDIPGQSPTDLRARCLSEGIVLSCRGGGLRISPHAYNTFAEIDHLVEVMAAETS